MGFLVGAFEITQIITLLVIARILLGIIELILIKAFKMNKYAGILVSAVIAFIVYGVPTYLLSGGVSDLAGSESQRRAMALREGEVLQTNITFMAIWLVVWAVIDLVIVTVAGKMSRPAQP